MPMIRMTRGRWFFALTILVLISACTAVFLKELAREITSSTSQGGSGEKERKLAGFEAQAGFQGKSGGIVDIQISAPNKDASRVGDPIELIATVSVKRNSALEFAWLLPENVTVAAGDVAGSLGQLERGKSVELRLSVVKSSEENQQIHLHVFQKIGNKRIGKTAQYNTVDQEAIDEEIRSKAEMLRTRMPASEGGANSKIMQ